MNKQARFSQRQLVFHELFLGTLIYAVVLGLFNDYTTIVEARSFSTIVSAAFVLQVLTFLAFMLKSHIMRWLRNHEGLVYRALTVFCVWLVMFLSKFVFIGALNIVIGDYIAVNGFFGILAVVVSVTVIHRLAQYVFGKLG
jgi:hypothetical protein